MAFMVPDYYFGQMWTCEDCNSEACEFPFTEFTQAEAEDLCEGDVELSRLGWWVRLSAPGYSDATDWQGPYETETEARKAVYDTWDVHPSTGDDVMEIDLDEAVQETPLTDQGYPEEAQRYAHRVRRGRQQRESKTRTDYPKPKSESDRMVDFFFPDLKKPKGSFLQGLRLPGSRRRKR
jgi:hypothetical protein